LPGAAGAGALAPKNARPAQPLARCERVLAIPRAGPVPDSLPRRLGGGHGASLPAALSAGPGCAAAFRVFRDALAGIPGCAVAVAAGFCAGVVAGCRVVRPAAAADCGVVPV